MIIRILFPTYRLYNYPASKEDSHPIFIGIHGNSQKPEILENLNYQNIDILAGARPHPRQYRKDQRKLPLQTHRQVPQRPPLPRPDARNAGSLRAGKAARQSHRRRRPALGRRYLIRTTDLEVPTMAIRNIVKEGDPILNKVCRPVTNFDDRLATLLDDMRETILNYTTMLY